MASSPVNGERPSRGGFRRSSSNFASIPQRSLSFHERAGLAKDDAAANVLYTHPNVRIYTFQPPTDALKSLDKTQKTLPDADYPIDAIEVLPWRARTETLSAKGRLIIEKVQGSVHFLKAGELIHTIMKNSQCWCVDGESKFVMRVGKLKYQRIEFPTAEDDEKKKVEQFKEVISKILRFEKTPCPFKRGFHVDLPEDAITPRRRGPWRRRESSIPITPDESPVVRKSKASRTVSMRGMPPSSFPSKSMSQLDVERPRTASTPTSVARFSFPDVRTESPTNYTSGEENTDSERHDSESERPESSQHSEADESDQEPTHVPIIKSPLKNVETIPPAENQVPRLGTISSQTAHTADVPIESLDSSKPSCSPALESHGEDSHANSEGVLAEASSRTTQEKVAPHDQIDAPNPLTMDEQDCANNIPSTNDQVVENAELDSSDIAENQQAAGAAVASDLRTERSGDSWGEDHETRCVEEDNLGSERAEDHPNPAAETPNLSSQAKESTSHALSSRTDDHVGDLAEDQKRVQDVVPKISAPVVAQSETSPEASTEDLAETRTNDDAESVVSTDSFHTLFSDDSQLAVEGFLNTRPFQHRRELSEMTVTAASMSYDDAADEDDRIAPASSHESVSLETGIWPGHECQAPGAFTNGSELRQRLRRPRSLSPLPPASILAPPSRTDQPSPIPKELLQKAATLAVVKPIEVFMFVVHILSRIAQGATMSDLMSGDLFRRPGARRTASGTFEQNIRGRPVATDSEDEDDYGFGRRKNSSRDSDTGRYLNGRDDDAASFASID